MWIEGKDSDGWNSNYFVLLRYARCLSVHQKSVSIVNIVNRLIGYNRKLISLSFKENLLLYSWSTFLLVVCSSLTKDLVFLRFVIRCTLFFRCYQRKLCYKKYKFYYQTCIDNFFQLHIEFHVVTRETKKFSAIMTLKLIVNKIASIWIIFHFLVGVGLCNCRQVSHR